MVPVEALHAHGRVPDGVHAQTLRAQALWRGGKQGRQQAVYGFLSTRRRVSPTDRLPG